MALNFPNELAADQMTAESYLQRGLSSVQGAVAKESQEVKKEIETNLQPPQPPEQSSQRFGPS